VCSDPSTGACVRDGEGGRVRVGRHGGGGRRGRLGWSTVVGDAEVWPVQGTQRRDWLRGRGARVAKTKKSVNKQEDIEGGSTHHRPGKRRRHVDLENTSERGHLGH